MAGPRYVRTHSIHNETAEDPSVCPRTLHMSPPCLDTKKNLLTKMPLNIHTCSRSSLETFRGDAIQRVGSPHGEAASERPAGADGGSRGRVRPPHVRIDVAHVMRQDRPSFADDKQRQNLSALQEQGRVCRSSHVSITQLGSRLSVLLT